MTVKFATVKGNSSLASAPFYFAIPQHEPTGFLRRADGDSEAGRRGFNFVRAGVRTGSHKNNV